MLATSGSVSQTVRGFDVPNHSKQVQRTCEKCGKVFSVSPSTLKYSPAKFCSSACKHDAWRQDGAGQRLPRESVTCKVCGKVFTAKSELSRRFCGNACMVRWRDNPLRPERKTRQGAGKTHCTCEQCGKAFATYTSWVSRGGGRFCSRQCLGAWVASRRVDVRESKLEQAFAASLREHGLTFQTQYRVAGFALDIAFPDLRLAVEVDGDYWHSTPKAIARDRKKDSVLAAEGWQIIHLREHFINTEREQAIQTVISATR